MHQRLQAIPFALALLIIAIVALPRTTSAQDPEAVRRELIDAMIAHVKQRNLEHAFHAGAAALAIREDRETFCSVGMIASRLERFPETAQLLTECVRLTTKASDDPNEIQKRLVHASTLEMARSRVGTLQIVAPPLATITVNHRKIGLAPIDQPVFVPANTPVEIHADNFDGKGSEGVTIAPGQSKTVIVRTRRSTKSPVFEAISAPERLAPLPPPKPLIPAPQMTTAFKISLIATLAAAGTTAHLGVASWMDEMDARARSLSVELRFKCGCECSIQPECSQAYDKMSRSALFQGLAITTGITTAIGVGVTIVLGKNMPVKTTAQGIGFVF
jgi:hypothetical protein